MSLRDSAAAFTRRYPIHPDTPPDAEWNMNCALLMARFALAPGGVGWKVAPRAYGDAITVADNSGPLNKDAAAAPVGAWHFWDWNLYGHVGTDLAGGGTDVFMASAFLREAWGQHIGINSVAGYNAANKSAKYLGWATNYRGGVYNLPPSTASSGSKPLADRKETDMPFAAILQFDGTRDGGSAFLFTQLTVRGLNGGDVNRAVAHYGIEPIGVPLGKDGDAIVNAVCGDFDWSDYFDWQSLNRAKVPVGATFRNPHYTIKP